MLNTFNCFIYADATNKIKHTFINVCYLYESALYFMIQCSKILFICNLNTTKDFDCKTKKAVTATSGLVTCKTKATDVPYTLQEQLRSEEGDWPYQRVAVSSRLAAARVQPIYAV